MTNHCTLCKGANLDFALRFPDVNGNPVEFYLCTECGSLVPRFELSRDVDALEQQVRFHEDWWEDSLADELEQNLRSMVGVIANLQNVLGSPQIGGGVVELGCGRGTMLRALRDAGYSAIGCEPSARLAEIARTHYGLARDILFEMTAEAFLSGPVPRLSQPPQAVVLWHVLEHLAEPLSLLCRVHDVLQHGGHLILQLPLLHQQYVYPEHYFFVGDITLHYLATRCGFVVASLEYDKDMFFLTACLRKASHTFDSVSEQRAFQKQVSAVGQAILLRDRSIEEKRALVDERMEIINHMSTEISNRDHVIATQAAMLDAIKNKLSNLEGHPLLRPLSWAMRMKGSVLSNISVKFNHRRFFCMNERSRNFEKRDNNRYWWHKTSSTRYVPLLYGFLSQAEWALMQNWFDDTESRFAGTGEASVPCLSMLFGLISGNGLSRIVQCGHYIGYSTLLMAFLLRGMGKNNALFSIDIDPEVTHYTAAWLTKAGLDPQVRLLISDSADSNCPDLAKQYFGGLSPQLVFIDSSHQYAHTLRELDLWYDILPKGGFLVLHDTSRFAASFDATGGGGVFRGVCEWSAIRDLSPLMINAFVDAGAPGDYPYLDGCGLAVLQKT